MHDSLTNNNYGLAYTKKTGTYEKILNIFYALLLITTFMLNLLSASITGLLLHKAAFFFNILIVLFSSAYFISTLLYKKWKERIQKDLIFKMERNSEKSDQLVLFLTSINSETANVEQFVKSLDVDFHKLKDTFLMVSEGASAQVSEVENSTVSIVQLSHKINDVSLHI